MYIDLYCSACGECKRLSFATLYDGWVKGYESMAEEYKSEAKAATYVECHCGHKERYDGPMFSYIFQLIFDEFIKEKEL